MWPYLITFIMHLPLMGQKKYVALFDFGLIMQLTPFE